MDRPVKEKFECENDNDNEEENDDDGDSEEFEDACDFEASDHGDFMTLEKALDEAKHAIVYFFNNQFIEAKQLMTPYANVSMYHSLGHAVFLFLEAILTIEPAAIREASKALKQALNVCNRFRKKNTFSESLGKIIKKNHFEHYTETEAHAELCHAEFLLLKSMLTFMEDETLASFVKAGFRIRSCYSSYKDCQQILQKRRWENERIKLDFESGVKMGIGAFNLMVSMLPTKVIRLLEFIGFAGNKELGLADLIDGYNRNGIRQILCTMTLLGYNLIVLQILSHKEGDMPLCEDILEKQLAKHPNGVWFLFFQGRIEFMKGNLNESIKYYTESWQSQDVWPQFHHICFWELLWVHCLKCEWEEALRFINYLYEDSKWSKCLYSYQKAVIIMMLNEELTPECDDYFEVDKLMREVPKFKQRIAGKSLPLEKFAVRKAERYYAQNNFLVLPVVELLFLWNLLRVMRNYTVASGIMKLIDDAEAYVDSNIKPSKYSHDNKALVYLLKGACLRHMECPHQAKDYFERVIGLKREIHEDHYLVPYAIVELALVEWSSGNKQMALLALEDAKKNYSGYSCESRLHFRIHIAMTDLKAEIKQSKRHR